MAKYISQLILLQVVNIGEIMYKIALFRQFLRNIATVYAAATAL